MSVRIESAGADDNTTEDATQRGYLPMPEAVEAFVAAARRRGSPKYLQV